MYCYYSNSLKPYHFTITYRVNKMPEGTEKKKIKILEPTFHFITRRIKIGEDHSTDKTPVSEIVMADQLLADFPNFERFASRGFEKALLMPGDNAIFSEDENSIIATIPGYPKIQQTPQKDSPEPATIVSVEPLFIISPDKMKVTLALHPPLSDGCSLKNCDIKDLLSSAGIIYGIDSEALSKVEQLINQSEPEFNKVVIALGQQVGTSTDAYLHFEMEIGPIAGTILKNGTIDFRDRRIMVGVSRQQLIATKCPAIQGEPGINVLGEETPAPEGKDLKIKLLSDAKFSNETMQVTATKDGVLSVVNDNVIKVCSRQIIDGDIDYNIGNVDSRSSVSIRGSVLPDFLVTTDGDLEISGSVMSTTIKCLGNIVIKGGITGSKTLIDVAGDCDINFIEQGKIACGGLCVIRSQSYYSDIYSGSNIRCRDDSKIMGGCLIAAGSITAGNIGSEDCKPSHIAAGAVAERLLQFRELKKSIAEQQDAIIVWLQRYRGSSNSRKVKKMERKLAETKIQLLRINMIPGSGIYSRAGGNEKDITESGEDYSKKGAIDISTIKIDVSGTIYAGTEIRIGNRTLKLDKTVSGRQFMLHANQKSIIAKPLKKK